MIKAEELINILQEYVATHGDIPVYISEWDNNTEDFVPVGVVGFENAGTINGVVLEYKDQ